jgi:hypothetical protein
MGKDRIFEKEGKITARKRKNEKSKHLEIYVFILENI